MALPGFTAESSLFKSERFRSTAQRFGIESHGVVPARMARQMCLPIVICDRTGCWVDPCGIVIVVPGAAAP
jgi:hypothetical protein